MANAYGSDLLEVPQEWLDPIAAQCTLERYVVHVPVGADGRGRTEPLAKGARLDFWEIFAGVGNATAAALRTVSDVNALGTVSDVAGGLRVGPLVDKLPNRRWPQCMTWDLLKPKFRQLVWAVVATAKPFWIHLGPPCTFWSALSRTNCKRGYYEQERYRIEALAFLVFSIQICRHQVQQKRHCSLEQPPTSSSWKLDIMNQCVSQLGLCRVITDSCPWGHQDPGSHRPYRKPQCFVSSVEMSRLARQCQCRTAHQRIECCVRGGIRHGERRSKVSGEYPERFCVAWMELVHSLCRPR